MEATRLQPKPDQRKFGGSSTIIKDANVVIHKLRERNTVVTLIAITAVVEDGGFALNYEYL